jgi:uncharacterized membrane protein
VTSAGVQAGSSASTEAGAGPAGEQPGVPVVSARPALWWPPYALGLLLFAGYAACSLVRAAHVQTAAYDLGIFAQAVRDYAHFQAPMVPIKGPGFNLLGDHFSPALAVLAPVWWIWSDPRVLLVAQAALLAASAVPITRLASRRLGTGAGLAIGLAYGLSWGLQGAVVFDFHEIALAVPLLAAAMVALADRRWWPAVWWAAPVVLVKEDLGITLAAIGGYLLLRRLWRPGLTALLLGAGAFLLTTLVIIPRLDHAFHTYRYWGVVTHGPANTGGAPGLGDLWHLVTGLPHQAVTPAGKLGLVAWVFGVTCFLALRSPLALIAVPTLLWRLVSSNPLYWSTGQVHYNAILMPIVMVALVDALTLLQAASPRPAAVAPASVAPASGPAGSRRRWRARAVRLAPLAVLAVAVATLPRFSMADIARADLGGRTEHQRAAIDLAGRIPSGTRVSVSNYLLPLLVGRCDVVLFPDVHNRPIDYLLVDSTNLDGVPGDAALQVPAFEALPSRGFRPIAQRDGIILYRPSA